jgi:hypothetical protein
MSRVFSPENLWHPDFSGVWKCVHTWGLEDFLRAGGAGWFQVSAASALSWPSWEFEQHGNSITYINHTPVGDIRETFEVGGPEYIQKDLDRKEHYSTATWSNRALVIERRGPEGHFRETRSIDSQGKLIFELLAVEPTTKPGIAGKSFGRQFIRTSSPKV